MNQVAKKLLRNYETKKVEFVNNVHLDEFLTPYSHNLFQSSAIWVFNVIIEQLISE